MSGSIHIKDVRNVQAQIAKAVNSAGGTLRPLGYKAQPGEEVWQWRSDGLGHLAVASLKPGSDQAVSQRILAAVRELGQESFIRASRC